METRARKGNKRRSVCQNGAATTKRKKVMDKDNGENVKTTGLQMVDHEEVNHALRHAVSNWLDRYSRVTRLNAELCLRDLVDLQSMGSGGWRSDVLSLREVQKRITWVAQTMRELTDRKKRDAISLVLRKVLQPEDEITPSLFPNIREVVESISSKSYTTDPCKLNKISNLPDMLQESLDSIPDKAEQVVSYLRCAQWRLEATIRAYSQGVDNIYHYLVCVGVLRLFGFKVNGFFFAHELCKNDLGYMIEMLKIRLNAFDTLQGKARLQAYVIELMLYSTQDIQNSLEFVIDKFPEELCPELKEICEHDNDSCNFEEIRHEISKLLPKAREHLKVNWESLLLSFKDQLRFISDLDQNKNCEVKVTGKCLSDSVESVLTLLNMQKYYPQKLTYVDVIKLTPDVFSDRNTKPTTLSELPWYFMKHIIALDGETRENCHVPRSRRDNSGNSSDTDDETMSDIHPLDLIYVIFLCADDFLRQELADRMVKCQYAVPFILPSAEKNIKLKSCILHWALRSITRTFYHNEHVVNQTLINVEAPVVVFMHSGEDTAWKSRIMNKMLSPQQETFWHRELKGGDSGQLCSQGMVEAAWYLPGKHENIFPYPVTFLNLRMDVEPSGGICHALYAFSSVCCVFTTEIDDRIRDFLKNKTVLRKLVLIILHRQEEEKEVIKECAELVTSVGLQKHQIFRRTANEANFNVEFEHLRKEIEQRTSTPTGRHSLSTFETAGSHVMEVDNSKCYLAQMAAESILRDIDELNARDETCAKSKILPCQSDIKLRQKMSELDKELFRQRRRDENTSVQEYGLGIKEQKWQLQLSQLQVPISETFKYFLNCFQRFCLHERKYFLQCLKLGLNERSEQMLRPLYEEYERCRIGDGTNKEGKLREINENLMHRSLGVEHFFRELAVLYENIVALKGQSRSSRANEILKALARSMASTMKEGTAIEIMDGDAVHVPVEWLKAVLTNVEDKCRSTLFKVSVLGAQSCGKSTLLNTVFGLNFPVSSGRCTHGAHMHLVKVDKSLEEELHCSYVVVIDSGKLMFRAKTDDTDYDNELWTFLIGLSDVTLVVIKGNGKEIIDTLSSAIHMFLRMNIVGEHQACRFIHQNMGAADSLIKNTKIDTFVGELNEKTLAVAKDLDRHNRYKKFADVLHYDSRKDNTYVPNLWTGTPPMGRASSDYSKTLLKLKTEIIKSIANPVIFKHKKFCTFLQLSDQLTELWQAIKYENLHSLKNVLVVEAHKKLAKVLTEEQWILKRGIDGMIKQEKNVIENQIKLSHSNKPVKDLTKNSIKKIQSRIVEKIKVIQEEILHYFDCHGCSECSSLVTNRHLLVNYEEEFRDELQCLELALIKELNSCMETFEITIKSEKKINELSIAMDTKLKRELNEAIRTRKSKHLSKSELEQVFDNLWDEATGDILRSVKEVNEEEDIEAVVQSVKRSLLGSEDNHYMQILTSKKGVARSKAGKVTFKVVPDKHMQLIMRRWEDYKDKITEGDVQRLQKITDSIIGDTKRHYENNSPGGRQFHQRYVEELYVDVLTRIDGIKDQRFKTSVLYKVEVLRCVEIMAVEGFTKMHYNYMKQSSPEAILAEKKNSYRDMFMLNMGYDNVAVGFCDSILKEIILRNIDEELACTELLQELRNNFKEMFRDIKSIQGVVMVEMFHERNFINYIEYITNYEASVKRRIDKECEQYFVKDKKYKELAQKALDSLTNNILQAIDSTVKSTCSTKTFLKTFFSKIGYLKIHPHGISAYLIQDVHDKKQFKENVHQQLNGRLRDTIRKEINTWNAKTKLKQKKLTDFLFAELGGCKSTCPFCGVPCDVHSGDKTQGNHSANLHRPLALFGYRWEDTRKFMTADCHSYMASDHVFLHGNPETSTPYKKYRTVYPDWTIQPETDPDVEKYWQWVFAEYNEEFSKYYSIPKAVLPETWGRYETEDIAKDIEVHYNIKVNRSQLDRA